MTSRTQLVTVVIFFRYIPKAQRQQEKTSSGNRTEFLELTPLMRELHQPNLFCHIYKPPPENTLEAEAIVPEDSRNSSRCSTPLDVSYYPTPATTPDPNIHQSASSLTNTQHHLDGTFLTCCSSTSSCLSPKLNCYTNSIVSSNSNQLTAAIDDTTTDTDHLTESDAEYSTSSRLDEPPHHWQSSTPQSEQDDSKSDHFTSSTLSNSHLKPVSPLSSSSPFTNNKSSEYQRYGIEGYSASVYSTPYSPDSSNGVAEDEDSLSSLDRDYFLSHPSSKSEH